MFLHTHSSRSKCPLLAFRSSVFHRAQPLHTHTHWADQRRGSSFKLFPNVFLKIWCYRSNNCFLSRLPHSKRRDAHCEVTDDILSTIICYDCHIEYIHNEFVSHFKVQCLLLPAVFLWSERTCRRHIRWGLRSAGAAAGLWESQQSSAGCPTASPPRWACPRVRDSELPASTSHLKAIPHTGDRLGDSASCTGGEQEKLLLLSADCVCLTIVQPGITMTNILYFCVRGLLTKAVPEMLSMHRRRSVG